MQPRNKPGVWTSWGDMWRVMRYGVTGSIFLTLWALSLVMACQYIGSSWAWAWAVLVVLATLWFWLVTDDLDEEQEQILRNALERSAQIKGQQRWGAQDE